MRWGRADVAFGALVGFAMASALFIAVTRPELAKAIGAFLGAIF